MNTVIRQNKNDGHVHLTSGIYCARTVRVFSCSNSGWVMERQGDGSYITTAEGLKYYRNTLPEIDSRVLCNSSEELLSVIRREYKKGKKLRLAHQKKKEKILNELYNFCASARF